MTLPERHGALLLVEEPDLVGEELGVVHPHLDVAETVAGRLVDDSPAACRTTASLPAACSAAAPTRWPAAAEDRAEDQNRAHVRGYHGPRSSLITSPSRKIDPATTMRGDRRHAAVERGADGRLDEDRAIGARRAARRRPGSTDRATRIRRARHHERARHRRERAQHRRDVLVAHRREHERAADDRSRGMRAGRARRRDCAPRRAAPRVRRAGAAPRAVPATRPARGLRAIAASGTVMPRSFEHLEEPDGDRGVVHLMRHRARASRSRSRSDRVRVDRARVDRPAPRSSARPSLDRLACRARQCTSRRRPAPRLDDARLLAGDRRQRVAEVLLMIESDRRDRRDHRQQHVRRVEPAAEADFADGDVDRAARRNSSKATAVVTSKNVGCACSVSARDQVRRRRRARRRRRRRARARSTGWPSMTKRSARSTRCGEVYRADRWPAARSAASTIAVDRSLAVGAGDVDGRNARSGWPSASTSARMLSRPNLMPNCSRLKSQSSGSRIRAVLRLRLRSRLRMRLRRRRRAACGRRDRRRRARP